MRTLFSLLLALLLWAPPAFSSDDYTQSIEQWREKRIESLHKPDGWFSYAGSGIVNLGKSTVGSASDNDIVLPKGPARLGTLTVNKAGTARFSAARDSGALIDGKPIKGKVVLKDKAADGKPTRVTVGDAWFYLVPMDNVIGWRFRDPDSPALRAFNGIDFFPIDPSWRVEADWIPYDPPREIELVTIINTLNQASIPGKAVFERNGEQYTLEPVLEDDGSLFFIFADKTSGKQTYGAGRFLYTEMAANGKVTIDFNKAYNPPCALSPHVVCPTAPARNRLRLPVEAGEMVYSSPLK
ncbi:DUF1684 domain-containing protein [Dokdonella sp.]|uniref:DUF1684 domain-containing protein n=1 Tax=Dokdonella sp. TaxID=2291710 RepID=UPI003C338A5D